MNLKNRLQTLIDQKTKPLGALGRLEEIALKIGLILETEHPELRNPNLIVFAADHGLAQEGVSAYPPKVTRQMVLNFLHGGAAVNVFCRQHAIRLTIVDAGVNADFEPHPDLLIAKTRKSTGNMVYEKAMTVEELHFSLDQGAAIVRKLADEGCNIIAFGEMGIGNTSSASLIFSALFDLPVEQCAGRGTGVDDQQFESKLATLKKVQKKHADVETVLDIAQTFGGFEIIQMTGAMLEAYQQKMIILVDGFITTASVALAAGIQPDLLNNCIFSHVSDESAHKTMLDRLGQKTLLDLHLRLGEGSGAALAYPLVQSAVAFLNEMASFESAQVSSKGEA